jgi:hypothetical protein
MADRQQCTAVPAFQVDNQFNLDCLVVVTHIRRRQRFGNSSCGPDALTLAAAAQTTSYLPRAPKQQ